MRLRLCVCVSCRVELCAVSVVHGKRGAVLYEPRAPHLCVCRSLICHGHGSKSIGPLCSLQRLRKAVAQPKSNARVALRKGCELAELRQRQRARRCLVYHIGRRRAYRQQGIERGVPRTAER